MWIGSPEDPDIAPVAGAFSGNHSRYGRSRTACHPDETAVKRWLCLGTSCCGKKIFSDGRAMLIPLSIGVVKDFHFQDCMWPSSPILTRVTRKGFEYLIVHTKPGIPAGSSGAQAAWKNMNRTSLSTYFPDVSFQKNMRRTIAFAGIVAISPLSASDSRLRLLPSAPNSVTKEIGVRKVLGAA